ncbi:MAG: arylamine N-acetyltransferase family protein [Bacillota bacterium]
MSASLTLDTATAGVDLDAYFRRIAFRGKPAPTLATLREIQALHAEAIPFENLSAFIGEEISLDVGALERKLVHGGRGGWCFEQNTLFAHELRAIGFELKTLSARVRWNVAPDVQRPRSHMVLLVQTDQGPHLADVGFGGLTLSAPLRFESGLVQDTLHETFRIEQAGDDHMLEVHIADNWVPMYRFDLRESILPDYEVSNWYLSHHPESPFVVGITAARNEPGKRHALRNRRYTVHRRGAPSESREIETIEELKQVLAGPLRIRLPESPALDRRLATLFA